MTTQSSALSLGLALLLLGVAGDAPRQPVRFAFDFGRTMSVDYFHTGGPTGEIVALDRS